MPRSVRTMRSFASDTGCALRNSRFSFGDLCSRLWLCPALRRRSFPVPVTENFFFAPEFVFCFGMFYSCVLRRREHHRHVAALEQGLGLDQSQLLHVVGEPHEQVAAAIRMLALATAEHDRDLDLRPLVEEADDVALLGLVIVNPDLRSELDLLDVNLR